MTIAAAGALWRACQLSTWVHWTGCVRGRPAKQPRAGHGTGRAQLLLQSADQGLSAASGSLQDANGEWSATSYSAEKKQDWQKFIDVKVHKRKAAVPLTDTKPIAGEKRGELQPGEMPPWQPPPPEEGLQEDRFRPSS